MQDWATVEKDSWNLKVCKEGSWIREIDQSDLMFYNTPYLGQSFFLEYSLIPCDASTLNGQAICATDQEILDYFKPSSESIDAGNPETDSKSQYFKLVSFFWYESYIA